MENDDTEELRLALVMNGGVSLAVFESSVPDQRTEAAISHHWRAALGGLKRLLR